MKLSDDFLSQLNDPWIKNNKIEQNKSNVEIINSKNKVVVHPFGYYKNHMNIIKVFACRYLKNPKGPCQEIYNPIKNTWGKITVERFFNDISACAKGLIKLGIKKGSKVCLMSKTRYEWGLIDMALLSIGAVVVPIYETSSPSQIKHITSDSNAKFIICESQEYADTIISSDNKLKGSEKIFVINYGFIEHLMKIGSDISDEKLESVWNKVNIDDLATLIYTSGTTAEPKGTKLTHGNFCNLTLNIVEDYSINSLRDVIADHGCRTLMFLPLAHVYARSVQIIGFLANTVVGHCPNIKKITDYCQSFKPTFVVAVPRVMEKIYNTALLNADTNLKNKIFSNATYYSQKKSEIMSKDENNSDDLSIGFTSIKDKFAYGMGKVLVYKKILNILGGKLKYFVSGGAPLDKNLAHFFRGLGITVIEGYGLTETTGPAAVNRPLASHIGSVGLPMAGISTKIAKDGEIYMKGLSIFDGYKGLKNIKAKTKNGYFKTGDIGRFDSKGRLYITGRKKEIIVTAGGKNVAPTQLEDLIRSHPLISQILVVGDKKPFISALITLDPEVLPSWLKLNKLNTDMTIGMARVNKKVLQSLKDAVQKANGAVSKAESIKKIHVLNTNWTEENDYLTTTQKLKRNRIEMDFQAEIEELYSKNFNKASIDIY